MDRISAVISDSIHWIQKTFWKIVIFKTFINYLYKWSLLSRDVARVLEGVEGFVGLKTSILAHSDQERGKMQPGIPWPSAWYWVDLSTLLTCLLKWAIYKLENFLLPLKWCGQSFQGFWRNDVDCLQSKLWNWNSEFSVVLLLMKIDITATQFENVIKCGREKYFHWKAIQ